MRKRCTVQVELILRSAGDLLSLSPCLLLQGFLSCNAERCHLGVCLYMCLLHVLDFTLQLLSVNPLRLGPAGLPHERAFLISRLRLEREISKRKSEDAEMDKDESK